MLTVDELRVLLPLIDAGVRATGLQLFKAPRGGELLESALAKLQAMADEGEGAAVEPAPKL